MEPTSFVQRLVRRVTTFRCRACAARYPRHLRRCPDCRTRKFEYGYAVGRIKHM
jgi:lipopolysaccharide biosynthesis regulator YciM